MGRYGEGLQVTIELMFNCFQGQTNVAALNVDLNIVSKARPIVFPTDELSNFIDAKMPWQWIVIVLTNELCLNDFWHER